MSKVEKALVIGGGVAGPVTALALRKAGIEATVYEAYPSTADGIGGSLALAPNGQAALDVVGALSSLPGLPIPSQVMAFGGRQVEMPRLSGVPPLLLVQRADLYRTLYDVAVAAGVPFMHGKRLVSVASTVDGVTAHFADGTSAAGDVLIGADGVHSTVRGLIDPAAPGPKYTGMLGLEAIVDHPVPTGTGVMHFAFGKRAYYLYWRRPDGTTHFGANLPQDRPLASNAVSRSAWLARLVAAYGEDVPGGELVRHIDPADLVVTGALHIMPPVPHWYRDRLVLVGDAVHAPSNTSGQGASLAIESAIELARCLRDLPDVPSAFAAYVAMRRPRVEGIAARAAKVNQMKTPGPVVKALMPVLMRLLLKTAMRPEKTFGPDQRFRIDFDAPVVSPALANT
jgi:2-polyprenyl-6-methoxyphenol hydroxylase-like FAD-dependent oxidoreductase